MNNKGFAITGIIYGLMVLFVFILSSFLAVVVGKNKRSEELTKSVYDSIMVDVKNVHSFNSALSDEEMFDKVSHTYVTSERAKYVFYNDDETVCGEVYLPKGIEIEINDYGEAIYNTTNKIEGCNYNICPNTLEFNYTGDVQIFTVTCPGKYKLEVWGAQGADGTMYYGGYGGYSIGEVYLNQGDTLYVYVGESGATSTDGNNSFNGGGGRTGCCSGGGATDVRINQDSLYSRVIVAGGGGGGVSADGTLIANITAGSGGGTTGGSGYGRSSTNSSIYSTYTGGTQTTGYAFGVGDPNHSGGGGWYGGYVSASGLDIITGSGGSGWIYTENTYNNWCTGNSSDCASWLLNINYYLTNAQTIAGVSRYKDKGGSTIIPRSVFADPNGTLVAGHSGNGYARITYLDY